MSKEKTTLFQRSSRSVIPKHYDLTIRPDLEKFIFDGQVRIDIEIKQSTNTIILHAVDLEIDEAMIS